MPRPEQSAIAVRIYASSVAKLHALDELGKLDLHRRAAKQESPRRFVIPGLLSQAQIRKVRQAGYRVEVVHRVATVAAERRRQLAPPARRRARARLAATAAVAETVDGYLTPEGVEEAIAGLRDAHSGLVELIQAPEPTHEGRVSGILRIRGANPALPPATDRVGVLFTGSMHAREWGGSDICVAFATRLLDAFAAGGPLRFGNRVYSQPQVRKILSTLDLFVFPDVNPDGKAYSQTQQLLWRKNRNPNNSARPATQGVDNNRNFDFLWSSGIGSSQNRSDETFRGAAAFSEPETRNVKHLFDTFPNIRYYLDIHSFGKLILYCWGDDDNQSNDPIQNFGNAAFEGARGVVGDSAYREFIDAADETELRRLADGMNAALSAVRGNPYTVQQAVGLYATSGGSDDYVFSRHIVDPARPKVYGFTIEFGEEFVPPYEEMRNIIDEVAAAMTELCRMAAS